MADFRQLSETMLASPQIGVDEVDQAKARGVSLIINNRPDGEEPGQPSGSEIEDAALAAGIAYRAIPITHAGFSMPQIEAMADVLQSAEGTVLGYCRSGTRSTFLWALAQAKLGKEPGEIAAAAQAAGYDLAPIMPTLEMLATKAD